MTQERVDVAAVDAPDPVPVLLTPTQMLESQVVAYGRRCARSGQGRRDQFETASDADGYVNDCVGAYAERAVAVLLGVDYDGNVGGRDSSSGDVGGLQVRATVHAEGSLIVHDYDDLDAVYVLVTGRAPRLYVRGWLLGREVAEIGEWHADRLAPGWWARPYMLEPWDTRPFGPVTS